MWDVILDEGESFLNAGRVFPLQQRSVKAVLDVLSKRDDVDKVMLFGSSIACRHPFKRDIDILIEGSCDDVAEIDRALKDIDKPCDVLIRSHLADSWRMLRKIEETGVVIYERENPA